jgi:glutamyl-tRNA reductase
MRGRERPLFILDLAVPRDVEPSAGEVPGVRLVDLEGLRDTLDALPDRAASDVAAARAILADELRRFAVRRRSERLAPVIQALRERGDDVVAAELERFRSDLSALAPDERAAVEALARGIVAKLLHDPIVRLKELSAPGTEDAHAKLLLALFGLEPPTP